jgi:hypothetical protein
LAGKANLKSFEDFINARKNDSKWQEYILPGGKELNKTAISDSKECGFKRTVFVQNPAIKARYARLVEELISKGILKGDNDNIPLGSTGLSRDEAVLELMNTIAELETEIDDLMRFLKKTETKVTEYEDEAKIIIRGRADKKKGGR